MSELENTLMTGCLLVAVIRVLLPVDQEDRPSRIGDQEILGR